MFKRFSSVMQLLRSSGFVFTLGLFIVASVENAAAQNLQADMRLMMEMFAGEFDNYQQVFEEKEAKTEHPHEHIHSIFAPVRLPAFGEHVFFVQQYMDADPTKIYRQRIYSFRTNEKERAIELRIYAFPDPKLYVNAHLDPAKLATLSPDKLTVYPGCEVFWRREDDRFIGYMKPGGCRVTSSRSGRTLLISDDLVLTRDEIWIKDQATDEKGTYVYGNKANVHHKLKRARRFDGWIALRKEGTEDQYDLVRGVQLHDQGQTAAVKIGDATTSPKYSVQLAQLTYQNTKTPVLKLGIIENATSKTVAYTWSDPDAKRIGINLRWIQAGFTLKK